MIGTALGLTDREAQLAAARCGQNNDAKHARGADANFERFPNKKCLDLLRTWTFFD